MTAGEVAIAWVATKGVLPIIGPRSLAQLESNLGAAQVKLSTDQVKRLNEVSAIPPIVPQTVLNNPRIIDLYTGGQSDRIDAPTQVVA